MKKKLLLTSVASLGLAASAWSAPTIEMGLRLVNEAGADVAAANINVGDSFYVMVSATLSGGYKTDILTGRSTATRNKDLGIQTLNVNLLTAPVGDKIVQPGAIDDAAVQKQWVYTEALFHPVLEEPFGSVYSSINMGDVDGDGDLDVNGGGLTRGTMSVSTGNGLHYYQVGVNYLDLFYGKFVAEKAGPITLSTKLTGAAVWKDPAASDNALIAENVGLSAMTNASLVLNVVGGGPTKSYNSIASMLANADPSDDIAGEFLWNDGSTKAVGAEKGEIKFASSIVAPDNSLYVMFWLTDMTPTDRIDDIQRIKDQFPDLAEASTAVEVISGEVFDALHGRYGNFNMLLKHVGDSGVLNGGFYAFDFSGNNVIVNQIAAVPEPASLLSLGGLSFLGFMLGRRRR